MSQRAADLDRSLRAGIRQEPGGRQQDERQQGQGQQGRATRARAAACRTKVRTRTRDRTRSRRRRPRRPIAEGSKRLKLKRRSAGRTDVREGEGSRAIEGVREGRNPRPTRESSPYDTVVEDGLRENNVLPRVVRPCAPSILDRSGPANPERKTEGEPQNDHAATNTNGLPHYTERPRSRHRSRAAAATERSASTPAPPARASGASPRGGATRSSCASSAPSSHHRSEGSSAVSCRRSSPGGHVLLEGAPGLGKTHLVNHRADLPPRQLVRAHPVHAPT